MILKKITEWPPLLCLLLLDAFYILHHYNELFGFIPPASILLIVLTVFGGTAVIYMILRLITRNGIISAIGSYLLLLLLFYFGHYHDVLKTISKHSFLSSYKIILPFTFLVLFMIIRRFYKNQFAAKKFLQFLSLLTIVLLFVEVIISISKVIGLAKDNNLVYPEKPLAGNYKLSGLPDSLKPDIYYLVFDGYTNNSTLKNEWQFNNTGITGWLEEKGFFIADHSRSNYNSTLYSISSTFNLNYLDEKAVKNKTISTSLKARKSMSDNELFGILKAEHYQINFLAPFQNSIQDNGLRHTFDYIIDQKFFKPSLPGRIINDIWWNFRPKGNAYKPGSSVHPLQHHVDNAQQTIAHIKETVGAGSQEPPRFVYSHLMFSHEPHIYDTAGNLLPPDAIINTSLFDSYTWQIMYSNKVIQELVNYIRDNNRKNTIIIIAGDHGFRELPLSRSDIYFPILNALYFPDQNYTTLYKQISPVNTFRVILNQYFNQQLPLLEDRTILIKDY